MNNNSERIVTRDFVLLFTGNFIVVSIYFLLITTMAHYAVESFGAESSIAGLTASIFLIGGVTGRIFCGRFALSVGSKKLGMIALTVQLIMCILYLFDGFGLGFLIAVRLVHGLSFGVTNTVLPALAVNAIPASRLGEGTGYYMMSNSLGVGIGPLMSVLVVMGFEYSILFGICIALSVVALVTTALAKGDRSPSSSLSAKCEESDIGASAAPETNEGQKAEKEAQPRGLASVIDTSTFKISVFMFIVAFSYSSLNSFVNNYAIELGMGMFAPFVFLTYSVTLVITRLFTGKIQDTYGDNSILYPSIASMGVGLIIAAFASNPVMLLACGVFMATGFGTCMSVGQAAVLKRSTCADTSKTISTFFLLCDGGCGIGPFMLGFVISGAGYQAMYILCAAVAFCALIYYYFVQKTPRKKNS